MPADLIDADGPLAEGCQGSVMGKDADIYHGREHGHGPEDGGVGQT